MYILDKGRTILEETKSYSKGSYIYNYEIIPISDLFACSLFFLARYHIRNIIRHTTIATKKINATTQPATIPPAPAPLSLCSFAPAGRVGIVKTTLELDMAVLSAVDIAITLMVTLVVLVMAATMIHKVLKCKRS